MNPWQWLRWMMKNLTNKSMHESCAWTAAKTSLYTLTLNGQHIIGMVNAHIVLGQVILNQLNLTVTRISCALNAADPIA